MSASSAIRFRQWFAAMLAKRRRTHAAAPALLPPITPPNVRGKDIGGAAEVFWAAGVTGETGFSIEARDLDLGDDFAEVGTAPAGSVYFDWEPSGLNLEVRVRAFNAAGYSPYSNVATINLT